MKRYNLLLIDDQQRFTDMLAKRLRLRGCHCDVCYNGQQALDLVRRKNFFLVLLDLLLRTNLRLFLDRQACLHLGAYAFWHKPLDLGELMAILARIGETSP